MFFHASAFNQPVSNWDVSNVTDMSYLFSFTPFNQSLSTWNTTHVTSILGMFDNATAFNQPVANFNVSHVTNFSSVFHNASSFNQPLNSWDTSLSNSFSGTFQGATAFNQPLNNWVTSGVADMGYTFETASHFNQDLSNWDYSAVTYFYSFLEDTELSSANEDAFLQKLASSTLHVNLDTNVGLKSFSTTGESNRQFVQTRDGSVIHFQVSVTYQPGTHATLIGTGTQKGRTGDITTSVQIVPDAGCTFSHWSDEDPLGTSVGTTRSDTFGSDNLTVSAVITCAEQSTVTHHSITGTLVIEASTTTPNVHLWDGIRPFTSNPASTTDPEALRAIVLLMTQLLTAFTQLAAALKT
jgi:surface protein